MPALARPPRVVIVDLNNFARYPTIAVGYLTSILRRGGMEVRVLSPLAHGVPGVQREPRATLLGHIEQQVRMGTALSGSQMLARVRRRAVGVRRQRLERERHRVAERLRAELARGADIVLISSYLMYHDLCRELGEVCATSGVPLIIGGAYFYQKEVAGAWLDVPGLTALYGGEAEECIRGLVLAAISADDLTLFPGVHLPDGRNGPIAAPFRDLDSVPFPDYTDFPWNAYPHAIVPIITGRGCRWGACTFCSDVTSTAGRTFRSRSPANVLDEMEAQSRRHDAELFVFTDLKLNSNLHMWHGLLDGVRRRVPRARWVGAVHVGKRGANGLGKDELIAARAAGMVRLTTGLESGSQRVLDAMRKGTDLEATSDFLHAAKEAGISVRTTMILGYPGESAEDVLASAAFLRRHADAIDRVSLNRLAIVTGTALERSLTRRPGCTPSLVSLTIDHRTATMTHRHREAARLGYRAAVVRLVAAAHEINRKPLGGDARAFEGVM